MVMTRARLRELVQAGLGDLDGHPEQVGALGLDADNLGRPWASGKKRRDRGRPTVLATSGTGSGATVNCEGDAVGAHVGTNANVGRYHGERSVGGLSGARRGCSEMKTIKIGARQLAVLIREAFGEQLPNIAITDPRVNTWSDASFDVNRWRNLVPLGWDRTMGPPRAVAEHARDEGRRPAVPRGAAC